MCDCVFYVCIAQCNFITDHEILTSKMYSNYRIEEIQNRNNNKKNKEKSVIYTNRQGKSDITFLNLDQVFLYKKKQLTYCNNFFRIFENCKITFNILSNLVRLI